jgi:predicted DCC family thiol-disulfide oxidoreductase YuxK
MKAANKIIVYDDTCPMCNWYTGLFVKTGLLEKNGRLSFTEINPELMGLIDAKTCRNEIPLVDTTNNKVYYGTDALLEILGSRFPLLKKLFAVPALAFGIKKLYRLVSYNRRTIVAPKTSGKGFDCTPDFNMKYRLMFIFLGLIMNTLLLFPLQSIVVSKSLFVGTSLLQLQLAHAFLVIANIIAALFMKKETAIEYLGQINVLAIITSLLYLPLILVNKFSGIPVVINNLWLTAMLFIIVKEYFRRMRFAGIFPLHANIVATNILCLIVFIVYLIK